jgi:hypothetical protein
VNSIEGEAMGGTLIHSREFRVEEFGDGHFELVEIDGDSDNCSHASWNEMKELAFAHGVPKNVWPELLDHAFGIDVSLETVRKLQHPIREYVLELPEEVLNSHRWLRDIAKWFRNDEMVFFCGC